MLQNGIYRESEHHNAQIDCMMQFVHFQLLNARDYGIPQTRERLYCVGFKKTTDFKYPAPIPLKYRMYDFLEDYSLSEYFDKDSNSKILSCDVNHKNELVQDASKERFNDFPSISARKK